MNGAKDYFIKITMATGRIEYDTGGHGWTTERRERASGYYEGDAKIMLEQWSPGGRLHRLNHLLHAIEKVELEPIQ